MRTFLIAILCILASVINAQVTLTIQPAQHQAEIGDLHYGIFFEEINHAGDGGLYAELIRNRSFEDNTSTPEAWNASSNASIKLISSNLLNNAQGQALSMTFYAKGAVVTNSGFWGIKFIEGEIYSFSAFLRPTNYSGDLRLVLLDENSNEVGSTTVSVSKSSDWKKYTATITATGNARKGSFALISATSGSMDIDVASLFPPTFKNRSNGCRKDLAQMLADMKPSFMRFPGGCYIEGEYRDGSQNRFEWKKTIGAIEERPGHRNVNWNYRVSDGFGFHEMLQLSEDLGAAPLFVVNIGLGHNWYQPYDDLQEYIQEALDALEYANGDTSTKYGAMRAANGHPEPFNLKLIEIGNENYNFNFNNNSDQSDHYAERYWQFYQAIKNAYPDVMCIGNVESWGTDNPSWRNSYPTDAVDEHYYRDPSWFVKAFTKYDAYNRETSPKIYAGEYAVTSNFGTTGNLAAALGEAIYMQGMERNSDLCVMASYAPIFVNENDQKWMPDMIRFNSGESYGTPSYYVQKLMPNYIGKYNVAISETGNTSATTHHIGLSTWLTAAEFKDYSVTLANGTVYNASFNGSGANDWTSQGGNWIESNGILSQSDTGMEGKFYLNENFETGDNYTIQLKAKKTGGKEGFLIAFNIQDSQNFVWWNLGGWGNTQHAVEVCTNGTKNTVASMPGALETGKEYNLKIIVEGSHVQCYLDNALCHDFHLPINRNVYASATVDKDNTKLYIKLTNPNGSSANTLINLNDYHVTDAKLVQMTSGSDRDENTNDNHYNIVPTENALPVSGSKFLLTIPAYSFNIIECNIAQGSVNTETGIQVPEGISYIVLGNGLLSRGDAWGTRAVVDDYGLPIELTKNDKGYTLRYVDDATKFFGLASGNEPYTDISGDDATTWKFTLTADGNLALQHIATSLYLTLDGNNNVITTENESNAAAMRFISAAERNNIIAKNPWEEKTDYCESEDVTEKFLQNADFNPINEYWRVEMSKSIKVIEGAAEAYESYGMIEQVVTGLTPNGLYRFSLPAFVRGGNYNLMKTLKEQGFTLANAYIYANDHRKPLPAWVDGNKGENWPNTLAEAAESFIEGRYKAEIIGRADNNGNLTVGLLIPQNCPQQWVAWGTAKLESVAEPIDYTDKINDPSFEGYGSGWNINNMQMQTNNEPSAMKEGNVYCEIWTSAPNVLSDAIVQQEVTGLSNGTYLVTANCHAEMQGSNNEITGVYLFAGNNTIAVSKPATYAVKAKVTDGKLLIGFKAESCNANWITVDDFHLTLVSKQEGEPIPDTDFRMETLPLTSYLFAYFPSNEDENLYYAHSIDGFNYTPLNNGQRVMWSDSVAIKKGIRDPHIIRGVDGKTFYMVATDMRCAEGWSSNRGIVMYRSEDLIHWTHSTVHFPTKYPETWGHVTRVWAPETIWDPAYVNKDGSKGRYMVYFSLLTDDGTCEYDKVFYCYANDDFTDLITEPKHLFDRGRSTIDADIVFDDRDNLYHMIYKNEGDGGICHVSASSLTMPEGQEGTQWSTPSGGIQQTRVAVEGGGLFRLINSNKWVVMYDCYTSGYYQFCTTLDWNTYIFKQNTYTSGAFTPRHGSVLQLTSEEAERLFKAFPTNDYNPTLPDPVYDPSTGIESQRLQSATSKDIVYDLCGTAVENQRNLNTLPSGVYIVNGKKIKK